MNAHPPITVSPASSRRTRLGLGLLGAGLLGHLLAAQGIGGSTMAYRAHVTGFFILTLVSGAILAGLGYRFWRGRHDITLLILGALQALLGLVIYLARHRIG